MSVTVDREAGERVTTTQRSGSTQAGTITEINGLVFFSSTPDSLMQTVTSYSDFLEVTSVAGPGGEVSNTYDGTGRLSTRTVTSGSETRTESYTYYGSSHANAGQLQTKTAPYVAKFSGNTSDTTYTYDSLGRQVGESGAGTYPVKFSFNAYGDRQKMTTYRTFTSFSEPGDDTEWHMDPASGLLLAKEDAEGKSVSYTYHVGTNLVKTKTLARLSATATPIVISYGYDALGRMVKIDYSDATPDVEYTYRRDGGVAELVDGAGTHTFSDWSGNGQPQRETITGTGAHALSGLDWRMPVDGLGRRNGYSGALTPERGLMSEQTVPLPGPTWTYGTRGEVWKITSGSRVVEISHTATGSAVTRTLTRTDAAATALVLTSVETSNMNQGMVSVTHSRSGYSQTRGLGPVSDITGGISAAVDQVDPDFGVGGNSGSGRWAYTYDARGQVVADQRLYHDGTEYEEVPSLGHTVNDIGARGNSSLNRQDTQSNPGVQFWGIAPTAQAVSINGNSAARSGPVFSASFAADGVTGYPPKWQAVTVSATDGTETLQQTGDLYLPPLQETFVWDDDGNLKEDGRWEYAWDAENRLVSLTTKAFAATAGVPEARLNFAYDAKSRRVRKLMEKKGGSGWEVLSDTRFIYDGWNLVAEVEYVSSAADAPKNGAVAQTAAFLRRSYVWGPDVSGTWEGAGGVGGLLAVTRHERGTRGAETYWATIDLNGNVIGLVGTAHTRTATYEYDSYGKCVRANEPEAGLNPLRFSTKYTDAEMDLVYYGYRYYSPKMSQWISRDPIEEEGGINLYGFCRNDCISFVDVLGKKWQKAPKKKQPKNEYRVLWERDSKSDTLEQLAELLDLDPSEKSMWASPQSEKEDCPVSVPNIWIDANLLHGGGAWARVVNLGGVLGRAFTFTGKKRIKVDHAKDLVGTIEKHSGDIIGFSLYAHGSPDGVIAMPDKIIGQTEEGLPIFDLTRYTDQQSVLDAIAGNNFKLAKAQVMQCYSGFKGEVAGTSYDWGSKWSARVYGKPKVYEGVNAGGVDLKK